MTTIVERIEDKIKDEVEQFEWRDPDYSPNEHERALQLDFVRGLHCDHEYLRLVWQHYNEIIVGRIEDGDCVDCGCPGGNHWGGCGTIAEKGQSTDAS